MYKISARVGNMILNGSIDETGLTEKQIQEKAAAIFREAIVMNVEKAKLSGKEIKLPDLDKLPIEYEEILPPEQPEEPIKEKIYEAAKLDGLSRKELIEQKILAEKKLEQIDLALKESEEKEKQEIENSLIKEG
jgi:cyanate lyase